MMLVVIASLLLFQVTVSHGVRRGYKNALYIMKEFLDPDVMPMTDNEDDPVEVSIDVSLISILDINKERNQIEIVILQKTAWTNDVLQWRDLFNLSSVSLPTRYMWIPDITCYNLVEAPEVLSPNLAVITKKGQVNLVQSLRIRFICNLEQVESSDGANCTFKFGSWTYNALDLSLSTEGGGLDLSEYIPNSRYEMISTTSVKNRKLYTCCREPYEDVTYSFVIRKVNRDEPFPQ